MSSRISANAHDQVEVARELEPRRDVAVVVELRDDDLVAGLRAPGRRVRESAKLSVVMFAPKTTSSGAQPRNAPAGAPRLVDERLGAPARLEAAR